MARQVTPDILAPIAVDVLAPNAADIIGAVLGAPTAEADSWHRREMDYPVDRVRVGRRMRPLRDVSALAESMADPKIGLIHRISLLPDGTLVAGRHRLAAAKSLGWTTIPAVIMEIGELDAELVEIDENLRRTELTVLEQAQHFARRDEILRAKGLRAAASNGTNQHTAEVGAPGAPTITTATMAAQMGVSERSAQERLQIARGITAHVQGLIADHPLADSTKALLMISRQDEETQAAIAGLIIGGNASSVSEAIEIVERRSRLEDTGLINGLCRAIWDAKRAYPNLIGNLLAELQTGNSTGRYSPMLPADVRNATPEQWIEAARIVIEGGINKQDDHAVAPSQANGSRQQGAELAKCRICHKPLSDPAHAAAGIGPCCAAKEAKATAGDGGPEEESHQDTAPVSQRDGYDSDEWYTPAEYIEAARSVLGEIELDPASCALAQTVVKAGRYFNKEHDAMQYHWTTPALWLNPPYSKSQDWVERLITEYDAGHTEAAVILVNNATETRWFQALLRRFPVCFPASRLAFWRHDSENVGARQGQAFFLLTQQDTQVDDFKRIFGQFGPVLWANEMKGDVG